MLARGGCEKMAEKSPHRVDFCEGSLAKFISNYKRHKLSRRPKPFFLFLRKLGIRAADITMRVIITFSYIFTNSSNPKTS
jgi:hypothetical protein